MPRLYTAPISAVTPVITSDVMTIIAPANKAIRIKRIRGSGGASLSTPMLTVIQRSTGGSGGGGAITPSKANTSDAAASCVVNTTWSVQPSLTSGEIRYNEYWNAFGGGFDLTLDGREIYLVNSEQLSIRNTSGTGLMALEAEIEEL